MLFGWKRQVSPSHPLLTFPTETPASSSGVSVVSRQSLPEAAHSAIGPISAEMETVLGVIRDGMAVDERGFGFIRRDDRHPDLFVHVNALLDGGNSLVKGKRVSFEVAEDARSGKKQAINVRVLT